MASVLVSAKGVMCLQSSGSVSTHSNKVGLSIRVSLCDIVSCSRQAGRGICDSLASTSRQPNQAEVAISPGRTKSRRGSEVETKFHVTAERELVKEEKSSSESEFLSVEEDRKPLSRFSQFLREVARQDVWAGLLDPFQAGEGNASEVNYFIQELKLRDASNSPAPNISAPTSEIVPPIAKSSQAVSVVDEHDSPGVGCFPGSEGVSHSGSRIDVASVSSATELLCYAVEAATGTAPGSGSYTGVNNQVLSTAAVSNSLTNRSGLVAALEASNARSPNHIMMEIPQAELCRPAATCVTAAEIGSVENLALWLEERIGSSIISQWGISPGTKHVANLWCELVEGEISLEDSRPPKRSTHVTSVKIKNGDGHVLVEAYQELADGRRRPRNRPLSEKMRPGEQVEQACLRGIFEELGSQLGARDRVMMVPGSYRREEEERESFSYPGLPTRYVIHTMVAHIQQLPLTEFSTDEDESGHGGSPAGVAALKGNSLQKKPVGVKRHFWRWVPENRLAELCKR